MPKQAREKVQLTKQQTTPKKPEGWVEIKEKGKQKKVAAARKEEEAEKTTEDSFNNSGTTDDEEVGNVRQMKIVRAFKVTEEDVKTLIADRGRKHEGRRQAFFCDSGADVCLVNEAKATHQGVQRNP